MSNIIDSFQKLYNYIESRKVIDNAQTQKIDELTEQVQNLDQKIDDNDVQFDIYYDLLVIKKGSE